VLAELVDDPLFLLCGDPGVIVPALRELTGHTAAVQAYQELTSLPGPAIPPAERAAQLALAAAKTGSGELVRTWSAALRLFRATASWWPVAARWRAVARHRVVRSHRDAVNQILAASVFGEVVVVSAGEDGILGLTSLAEADLGADRRREPELQSAPTTRSRVAAGPLAAWRKAQTACSPSRSITTAGSRCSMR
jgi:hypothetical protein